MVVSPRYLNGSSDKNFSNAIDLGVRIKIHCFGGGQEVAFFHEFRAGVDWVSTINIHATILWNFFNLRMKVLVCMRTFFSKSVEYFQYAC